MQNDSRPHQIDPRLKGAFLHPKRVEIFNYLMRKPGGTRELELVKALGLSIRQVEYHLKVLQGADLIADLGDERAHGKGGRSYVTAAAAGR